MIRVMIASGTSTMPNKLFIPYAAQRTAQQFTYVVCKKISCCKGLWEELGILSDNKLYAWVSNSYAYYSCFMHFLVINN